MKMQTRFSPGSNNGKFRAECLNEHWFRDAAGHVFSDRLKKVKAVLITQNGLHRSGNVLLSHSLICSTIAAERLNFRVRNGNGWIPLAIVTEKNDWSSVICAVIDSRHNGLILA